VHHPGSGARFFQIRHQTNKLPHHVETVEGRHRELSVFLVVKQYPATSTSLSLCSLSSAWLP